MAKSAALHSRESPALARRGASSCSIPHWLVHAGSSRWSARHDYDAPYFVRFDRPRGDFVAAGLAYHSSRRAGKFAAAVAASFVRGGALAALRSGSRYNNDRLAVRIVPGLVVSYFYLLALPMLAEKDPVATHQIDGWHQFAEWALLIAIGIHVAAALAHIFIYHDRVMQRMLPSRW